MPSSLAFLRVFALLLAFCLAPGFAQAAPLNVKSAILMDVTTGRILYEQHPDQRIQPASLTKVLSLYVAYNSISARKTDYSNVVRVSRNAAGTGGSRMGLRAGDRVTLDKLFYGMAVASGNDASVAVAEHVAGSTGAFVKQMNALARRLGMKNSRFVNVHGLPDRNQYTTARDMLRLARSYQTVYPRARRYHLAPSVTHHGRTEPNHNPLVRSYPGILGLKTGWVTAAGYNIIASARRRGHTLIAVILGAPNTSVRTAEIRRLLNAGFDTLGRGPSATAKALGVTPRQAALLKK
ncbi:D-alanyl-D-alanine carboxypeptidase family protein [uncultured Mailhella sp.]|uniref:D-alanyl-D-alanine carboxypeptidase family protein n=1 Tax=uncultured Mailhella sp. TaxID=1981031 RepID=UPI0026264507|nr:D-alanyl-D-alanine carboxypeptidase family protein [uncultured Mailhella sp.]